MGQVRVSSLVLCSCQGFRPGVLSRMATPLTPSYPCLTPHNPSSQLYEPQSVSSFYRQGEPRLRECESLAQDDAAMEWQCSNQNMPLSTPAPASDLSTSLPASLRDEAGPR